MQQSSYHSTLYSLHSDTVIRWTTNNTPVRKAGVSPGMPDVILCHTSCNCQLVQLMQCPSHNPTGKCQALLCRDIPWAMEQALFLSTDMESWHVAYYTPYKRHWNDKQCYSAVTCMCVVLHCWTQQNLTHSAIQCCYPSCSILYRLNPRVLSQTLYNFQLRSSKYYL